MREDRGERVRYHRVTCVEQYNTALNGGTHRVTDYRPDDLCDGWMRRVMKKEDKIFICCL